MEQQGLPPATAVDPVQFPEERRSFPKTPLTAKQLRDFRAQLLELRAQIVGDVNAQFARRGENGSGEQSSMPVHMADLGSDNWEHEFNLGLLANEQERLREIDDALRRIEDKTFGICLATHNPIGLARLQAKPWAKYCIEYARAREEGRAR